MTEMVYKPTREPPKRLADGEYGGIHYYVLSLGAYPCAYIRLPDTCKNVETKDIDCHGGITYAGRTPATVEDEGFYIGWDYCKRNRRMKDNYKGG